MVSITERLEGVANNYQIYQRREECEDGNNIPFRVSPQSLELTIQQVEEIGDIGSDVTDYFQAVDELYREDGTVKNP